MPGLRYIKNIKAPEKIVVGAEVDKHAPTALRVKGGLYL